MKVYRIRHIPSGLYYCPARHVKVPNQEYGWIKSNLSKTGKLYPRKPSLKHIGRLYYNHLLATGEKGEKSPTAPFREEEWEIVEVA